MSTGAGEATTASAQGILGLDIRKVSLFDGCLELLKGKARCEAAHSCEYRSGCTRNVMWVAMYLGGGHHRLLPPTSCIYIYCPAAEGAASSLQRHTHDGELKPQQESVRYRFGSGHTCRFSQSILFSTVLESRQFSDSCIQRSHGIFSKMHQYACQYLCIHCTPLVLVALAALNLYTPHVHVARKLARTASARLLESISISLGLQS